MIIDFKEIPEANKGGGDQDTFELFARDFLEELGYEVNSGPDRGPDGGKDLIVTEKRAGIGGTSEVKWLVSCKHFASSGKSVGESDEQNITDRVTQHGCQGFIGFYSTLPSSGLQTRLHGLGFEHQVFDSKKIEGKLLKTKEGLKLAKRYFPQSIKNYEEENPAPANLFDGEHPLNCDYCGKDLVKEDNGIFVLLENKHAEDDKIMDVYFSCKGSCDSILRSKTEYYAYSWNDIDDLKIPTSYLHNIMRFTNLVRKKSVTEEAVEKLQYMYIKLFPTVARNLTTNEKERLETLQMLWDLPI